ncbi:MAG: ACT domain-containing protein, partial [Chloroflexi bacterium]
MNDSLKLSVISIPLAVCRLEASAPVPEWALAGEFFSITRTADELSIVCAETQVPASIRKESGWRGLKVEG